MADLGRLRGVFQADFNHDASRIVARWRDGKIGLWNVLDGTPVPGDLGFETPCESYVMSDNRRSVLVRFKHGARVFDAGSALAISPLLDVHLRECFQPQAFFSPDGEIGVALEANEASVWKVRSGERIGTIPLPSISGEDSADSTASAIFTNNGADCFVHDGRGTVTRFDTKNWQVTGKRMVHPESNYTFAVDVSRNGKWVATSDSPGENGPKGHLQIWDASTSQPVGAPLEAVNGIDSFFLEETNRVLIRPARGEATIRQLPSMKVAFALRRHDDLDGPRVRISPDEKWVLSWGPDRRINLYETLTGKLAGNTSSSAAVSAAIMSPDSSACYICFDNSAFSLQGYRDNYIMRLALPSLKITKSIRLLEYVRGASLSPDGRRLLVLQGGDHDARVLVLDAATLTRVGPETK